MSRVRINPQETEWYRCPKCQCSFFIKTGDPNKHLLKKSMRCPNHVRCKGRIVHRTWTADSEVRNFRWTNALELYQASAGLGFESERDCSPSSLRSLMLGHRIMAAEVEDTGDPKKSILVSVTLETGKIVHLSSSVKGAIVYKVTEVSNGR